VNTTHTRWIEKLYTDNGTMGAECMVCRFFIKLQGSLGYDWGACTNVVSSHDGAIVFEHAGCEHFEWAPCNMRLDDV
jgi:Protein of unknown function (DUF3027)